MSSPCLYISADALKHNYRFLQQYCQGRTVGAVVKANAYGLGFEIVIPVLLEAGCKVFFVNRPAEGIKVRQLAPKCTIYVLDAFMEEEGIEIYKQHNLIPVFSTIEALAMCPNENNIALRLDTGFGLAGVNAFDVQSVLDVLNGRNVSFLMSHLACAERPMDPQNDEQLALFIKYAEMFPHAQKSLSASFGVALGEMYWFDVIRAGAFLYGSSELEGSVPVARLTANVGWVRSFEAGECLGYNKSLVLTKPTVVASVLIGSGDGIVHRQGCFVDYDGTLLPVIGVPTTNYLAVDASAVAEIIRPNDNVDLFDILYTPDRLAADVGVEVGADVLIQLKESLPRQLV